MQALTIEELREMPGQPVWCPELKGYGIIKCDRKGRWEGIPFFYGALYNSEYGVSVNVEYNIEAHGLECYRVLKKNQYCIE